MHDHPDATALAILQHTKEAMEPQSVLFIDDIVVSDTGASVMATQLDMTMLAIFCAVERTEFEWRALFAKAGLSIKENYRYDREVGFSILEAVPIGFSREAESYQSY